MASKKKGKIEHHLITLINTSSEPGNKLLLFITVRDILTLQNPYKWH